MVPADWAASATFSRRAACGEEDDRNAALRGLDRGCRRGRHNQDETIPFRRGPGPVQRPSECVADVESSSGLPLFGQTREADMRLAGLCVTKPPLALRGE